MAKKYISRDSSFSDAGELRRLQKSVGQSGGLYTSSRTEAGNSPGRSREMKELYDAPGPDAVGRPPQGSFSSLKPMRTKPL